MQTEQLIYDTGKPPLAGRLMVLPFGLLAVYAAIVTAGESVGAAAALSTFGLFMLSVWFWGYRIYYDAACREIVTRSYIWIPRRLPVGGAISLLLRDARGGLTSAVIGTYIGLRYADRREIWLAQVIPGDAQHIARRFAEATSLPILPYDRPPSARASSAAITIIVGVIILGSFLSRQPAVFIWPLRVFCLIALVSVWRQSLEENKL
jgi:hypothetical protein